MKKRTLSKRQGFLLQKFRNGIIESDAKYGACDRKNKHDTRYCASIFNIRPYIYERAHAYARARERYRHTHIIWFSVCL